MFAVYEVTNTDAEDILKKSVHPAGDQRVVRIRGIPFTCTEADIAHFFSGSSLNICHTSGNLTDCYSASTLWNML